MKYFSKYVNFDSKTQIKLEKNKRETFCGRIYGQKMLYDLPMITKIHLHTQIDSNTLSYANYMLKAAYHFANKKSLLLTTVHCLDASMKEKVDTQHNVSLTKSVGGSTGHGVAIMDALAMTNDGDIHVIADSDTVIVKQGWDDILRKKFFDENFDIVGGTYEDVGGFSSGTGKVQTYKKIPTLTWCALSPRNDWRDLNVLPNKSHMIQINTDELSVTYNLPKGYVVFGEVGYQIPQYLRDKNLSYEGWRQIKPTSSESIILSGLCDYHEEFHVDNEPFFVHHRGSLRHPFRLNKMSNDFYDRLDLLIK
jgi:hypothetical protein